MEVPLPGWRELQESFSPVDVRTGERMRRVPPDLSSARRAAVLVPILTDPPGPRLVYTVRRDHLNDHAGQISFPGGAVDDLDGSPQATALREAEEEVAIPKGAVEVLGTLEDLYIPPSNFLVRPFVGLLAPGTKFVLSPQEVVEVFTVPLGTLLAPETFGTRRLERDGRTYSVPVFSAQTATKRHHIWGATAAMTASLLARLGWQRPA